MKKIVSMLVVAMGMMLAMPAMAELDLAKSKNCMACHAVDKKLVGPSFKDIAEKYDGQEVVGVLAEKTRAGSAGVWGAVPMPPNPLVSEADAEALVRWILAQK